MKSSAVQNYNMLNLSSLSRKVWRPNFYKKNEIAAQTQKNIALLSRFKQVTESAEIGVWDWDLKTNKQMGDAGMIKLFGKEDWQSCIHPDDSLRITDAIRKAIAGIAPFDTQYKIITSNGAIKTIQSKGVVSFNHKQQPESMMLINWDQTESAESLEKLQQSENLFRHIVETSPDGIWLHDESQKTVFVNPRFTNIFGYSATEMKETNIHDLIDPTFHNIVNEQIENRKKGLHNTYELLCITKTHEKIWIQVSATPILNGKQEFAGTLAILSNINSRKLIELEKEQITLDLIQRNKNMEQFSYIVSHNLRAPLANILGCAEIITNDSIDLPELKQIIEGIGVSAQKLDAVIKDLNFILQVKNPLVEKRETVYLEEIVTEIKNSISDIMLSKNVTLNTDFAEVEKLTSIKGYVYSIFYNLIYNSIKYQNPQVNPIIEIKSKQLEKGIKLTFTDNGSGIDLKKEGDKIFGLYKRFHPDIAGKGIGLFMVKTQLETMGGNISVASEPNIGTAFTIEIPVN